MEEKRTVTITTEEFIEMTMEIAELREKIRTIKKLLASTLYPADTLRDLLDVDYQEEA